MILVRLIVRLIDEVRAAAEDGCVTFGQLRRVRAHRRHVAEREARLSDLANPEMAEGLRLLLTREWAVRAALGEMDTDGGAAR